MLNVTDQSNLRCLLQILSCSIILHCFNLLFKFLSLILLFLVLIHQPLVFVCEHFCWGHWETFNCLGRDALCFLWFLISINHFIGLFRDFLWLRCLFCFSYQIVFKFGLLWHLWESIGDILGRLLLSFCEEFRELALGQGFLTSVRLGIKFSHFWYI